MKLGDSAIRMDFTDFSDEKSYQGPPTSTSKGLTLWWFTYMEQIGGLSLRIT